MKCYRFQLDKQAEQPLYVQLYQQIKTDISNGRLAYGERLPSKRQLADYLSISRNTVETAYSQLLAEGYVEAKVRQGFFVQFKAEQFFKTVESAVQTQAVKKTAVFRYDLNPNQIDTALFPLQRYKKIQKTVLQTQGIQLLNMGEKQGEIVLREQIRHYLYASRGISCSVEQIVLGAGVETCLSQLVLLLDQCSPQQSLHYAMEQYGYPMVEQLLSLFAKSVQKLPLFQPQADTYQLDFTCLAQSAVDVLYLTPSHQYPYGSVLSINERQQLLEWAQQQANRYIIEDDYDSEFRYKGKPIPSLQHLDGSLYSQGKVIYLGSFSKLLMPSLRVTFMVLPQALVPIYQQGCGLLNSTVPRINQHVLAQFMQSGEFERHIHRMRTHYRKKMELLCQLLQPYRHLIRYYGEHSGFYLLLELQQERRTVAELSRLAENVGIKIYPVKQQNAEKRYFSFGFGNVSLQDLNEAVILLMTAWGYEAR